MHLVKLTTILGLTLGSIALSAPSFATGANVQTWKYAEVVRTLNIDTGKPVRFDNNVLVAQSSDKMNVGITCSRNNLYVGLSLDDTDFTFNLLKAPSRATRRYETVTMTAGGEEISKSRWVYVRNENMVVPRDRDVINDVIRTLGSGEAVSFSFPNDDITLASASPVESGTIVLDFVKSCREHIYDGDNYHL